MRSCRTGLAFGARAGDELGGAGHRRLAQDKPVELKLSHWVPPSHPLQKALEDWGDSIKKASGGTITFTVFPAQQLGKAFDHYDMARDGIADVTYINPGYQPGRFPIIGAGELPFLMANAKGGSQALDAWYRKYAATEMKDVKFCFAFVHDPGSFHSTAKKIMVPGDIKGMKIRPAHAHHGHVRHVAGRHQRAVDAPEVRDMLEKGVADAVTFPWGSMPLFGIDKVTKYHMDVPLYATTFAWVMNKAKYDAMSAAQKKVIDDHCTNEWALQGRRPVGRLRARRRREAEGRARPRGLPDLARAAGRVAQGRRAAVKAHGPRNVKKAGGNPDAIYEELKAALAKYERGLIDPMRRHVGGGDHSPPWRNGSIRPGASHAARRSRAAQPHGSLHRHDRMGGGDLRRHRRRRTSSSRCCCATCSSVSIPDAYDFGRMLLGILIFWGIAATSYRGGHITVDLVWANVGPRWQRAIDVFATLVLLFVVTVQTYTLFDKVRGTYNDHVLTYDLRLPTWPFFAVAWAGDVSAVMLIAIRTWRLVFQPEELADEARRQPRRWSEAAWAPTPSPSSASSRCSR